LADDVHGEIFGEFRLPRAAEVLEKLGPALQTGPLDDPEQLGPQVGIRVPIPRDDILRPGFREFEALFQVGAEFRKKRNHTRLTTDMVFRLGTPDSDPVVFPVHVPPSQ
jgi:hypothetical protein